MTYNSVVLADSPKHYVTFDQAGSTNTDSGSQAATITVTGTPTKAAAISGTGLTYNGTTDYVTISSNQYDFGASSTFTFECWFKSTATTGQPTFIRRDGNGAAYLLRLNAGKIEFYCNQTGIVSTASYADGNWHHVVGVKNGTATTLYVDGTSVGTGTGNTVAQASGAQPIYLGESTTAASEMMKGTLDEVAIYSTALTSTQVTTHYNAGASVNSTQTPPPMAMTLSGRVPTFVGQAFGPMTLSLSTVTPTVLTTQPVTADGNSGATSQTTAVTNDTYAYFKVADFSAPTDKSVSNATFNAYINKVSPNALAVYRVTSSWTEASLQGGTQPTHDSTPVATFTPASGTGWNSVDITSLVAGWQAGTYSNYGIAIFTTAQDGNNDQIYTRESTHAPYITATYATSISATNAVPPMTLSLANPDVTDSVSYNLTNSVPPMSLSLDFPGGTEFNPDYLALPFPMSLSLFGAGSPVVDLEYPITVSVPAIDAGTVDTVPATVSLTTNILVSAPPATMTLRWVGIYDVASDRYLKKVPTTVDQDDIWYKMDETAGATRAVDSSFGYNTAVPPAVIWQQSGYYFGNVTQVPDGPQLRKAAHFNGTDSYLVVGPYARNNQYFGGTNDIFNQMALTIEFSIRTTQTDGIVFVGTGGFSADAAAVSPTIRDVATLNGHELRLEGGQLVIHNSTQSVKVRKNIADGQWHHIVMAIPSGSQMTGGGILQSGLYDTGVPSYVAIDGSPVLVRYSTFLPDAYGETWLPYSFMGKAVPKTDFDPNNPDNTGHNPVRSDTVTGLIAGDMRDLVVRLNSYVPMNLAESLYYEWSDSTLVEPTPITLSASTVDPFKVKGNTKKMLAVYGLPWNTEQSTGLPMQTYLSNLSGMVIENLATAFGSAGAVNVGGTISHGQGLYYKPKVFMLNDYLVYPVSIYGDTTLTGPVSVDGVISPDAVTDVYGNFVDDTTGLPRFINLQNDLSLDVAGEYDVVTVVNYPWVKPNAVPAHSTRETQDAMPIQPNHGLSNTEWSEARDALRDSILQAAYDGVNLWIGEYHMAMHLGFIQGVDIHNTGNFDFTVGTTNQAGELLDNAHLLPAFRQGIVEDRTGGYDAYPQVNFYRRIVNLEPGLTDIPSNEYGGWVEAYNNDRFLPYGEFLAYDIVRRPNGLQVGDLTKMSVSPSGSQFFNTDPAQDVEYLRKAVISAQPNGIVGKVIAREQLSYFGPGGVVVDNPYKNNAITIAAERGSVVRGRPIAGRAFIELMDTDTTPGYIREDANKVRWHGDPVAVGGGQASTWDFDTRRAKESKSTVISLTTKFDPTTGAISIIQNTTSYVISNDELYIMNKNVPMHARGLNWLAQGAQLAAGDAVTFATPMEISLATPAPAFARTANPVSQVFGPMRLNMEMRKLANFLDGSVEEYAQPMELSLDVRGTQSANAVPPMSLTVTTVAPALDVAADLITVYIDEDRSITLFLKEDN